MVIDTIPLYERKLVPSANATSYQSTLLGGRVSARRADWTISLAPKLPERWILVHKEIHAINYFNHVGVFELTAIVFVTIFGNF